MIGGTDIIYKCRPTKRHRDIVSSVIFQIWKDAWVFEYQSEVFFYENEAARDSWDNNGLTQENGDQVIYILFGLHEITFVVDGELSRTWQIAKNIITNLEFSKGK